MSDSDDDRDSLSGMEESGELEDIDYEEMLKSVELSRSKIEDSLKIKGPVQEDGFSGRSESPVGKGDFVLPSVESPVPSGVNQAKKKSVGRKRKKLRFSRSSGRSAQEKLLQNVSRKPVKQCTYTTNFETLTVSGQQVTSLDGLGKLAGVKYLNVNDNYLTSFKHLKVQRDLEELDVSNNCLCSFLGLKVQPKLRKLTLRGNPIGNHPLYRYMALLACGEQVREIDGKKVTVMERAFVQRHNIMNPLAAECVRNGWVMDLESSRSEEEYEKILRSVKKKDLDNPAVVMGEFGELFGTSGSTGSMKPTSVLENTLDVARKRVEKRNFSVKRKEANVKYLERRLREEKAAHARTRRNLLSLDDLLCFETLVISHTTLLPPLALGSEEKIPVKILMGNTFFRCVSSKGEEVEIIRVKYNEIDRTHFLKDRLSNFRFHFVLADSTEFDLLTSDEISGLMLFKTFHVFIQKKKGSLVKGLKGMEKGIEKRILNYLSGNTPLRKKKKKKGEATNLSDVKRRMRKCEERRALLEKVLREKLSMVEAEKERERAKERERTKEKKSVRKRELLELERRRVELERELERQEDEIRKHEKSELLRGDVVDEKRRIQREMDEEEMELNQLLNELETKDHFDDVEENEGEGENEAEEEDLDFVDLKYEKHEEEEQRENQEEEEEEQEEEIVDTEVDDILKDLHVSKEKEPASASLEDLIEKEEEEEEEKETEEKEEEELDDYSFQGLCNGKGVVFRFKIQSISFGGRDVAYEDISALDKLEEGGYLIEIDEEEAEEEEKVKWEIEGNQKRFEEILLKGVGEGSLEELKEKEEVKEEVVEEVKEDVVVKKKKKKKKKKRIKKKKVT